MTDILSRWLNQELRLSRVVDPTTFAQDFSSGYLIGEVLFKYQLQNDFSMFMKKDTSISKVNNFTRLEPTLRLLGISFDINTAQDLIQEKQGAATRLLYQIYIALEKRKKAEVSGIMMEIMQPAASASLHKKEHEIYTDRLHQVVKQETERKLPKISQQYGEKSQQKTERSLVNQPFQQQRNLKVLDEKKVKTTDKLQGFHQRHSDVTQNQAGINPVPKPPPYTSQLHPRKRHQQLQRKERQAQIVQAEIAQFETNRKKLGTTGFASYSSSASQTLSLDFSIGGSGHSSKVPGGETKLTLQSNEKYLQEIRQRLEENEQREKRVDRFLVEQFKAHEAREEARRDEQLVKRLTRQTRQEQRLASQLLQMRMQKEVIRQNRLFREQQHQERREKDFKEALDREAAVAQQAKLDHAEEIRKEVEFCKRIASERAEIKYQKHYKTCSEIMAQIVDLATKMGEYRLLNGNLIAEKQMREWKALLLCGLPLYEPLTNHQPESDSSLDPVELKKQDVLNNLDYDQYSNKEGEWALPEEAGELNLTPTNNNILGHVVHRLKNILHPPIKEPPAPFFPPFILKACVLGKFSTEKSSCLSKIAEALGIYVLSADMLLEEALKAHGNGEEVREEQEEKDKQQLVISETSLKSDLENAEDTKDSNIKLSKRAILGAAAEAELSRGKTLSNELLVDIIVEAIRRLPAHSGWILSGYPSDIAQAHLLERALGGSVEVEQEVVESRRNLALDPNPPKTPGPPTPVLDLALLLEITDQEVVTRAFSQIADTETASNLQQTEKNLYLPQIQCRITAFEATWPELQEWFGGKQKILVQVDGNVNDEELYSRLDSVLQGVLATKQKDEASNSVTAPGSSSTTPVPPDQPPLHSDEALGLAKSNSNLGQKKRPKSTALSRSNTHSPREQSGNASTSSVLKEDSQTSTKSQPETETSTPDSGSQVYMDKPLPPEIPKFLCPYWDAVCDSYVDNVKIVMQQLRSQCEFNSNCLYNTRKRFKHYLGRPDFKQEIVFQWQKVFNSTPDDERNPEDQRAQLQEMLERLWDISDKRKEKAEEERTSLMSGKWLENNTQALINIHSVLLQVELKRFQETLLFLRAYYLSMKTDAVKDQVESSYPRSMFSLIDDEEDETKITFTPVGTHPDSPESVSEIKDQEQTEAAGPQEKLISDYEETVAAIDKLVSAEAHQRETNEQKERAQNENKKPETGSASAKKKGQQSKKPQKALSSAPSPAPVEDKSTEKTLEQELITTVDTEYAAALKHEENAAKARIALVKGHGLMMLNSLQSSAQESFSSMEKWIQECFLAEMKSIEELSEVISHHIESGTKLLHKLVVESSDFYLNGDYHMVAGFIPERPPHIPLSVAQLESLHQQLCRITLPELQMVVNETQLMEIVPLLTDEHGLVDWQWFLLSAALPWPFPTLTQLLAVLQRFKAADTDDTGFLNVEKYLETEFWFTSEAGKTVSEDPTDDLPDEHLTNLRKFFFWLFADHTVVPPKLDYVSMLQYFAANTNPQQGFVRALSIVLGQILKHKSPDNLVKSMPSIQEDTELTSLDFAEQCGEEDTQHTAERFSGEPEVSITALLSVICHKVTRMKDTSSRLPWSLEEHTEHLVHVFRELGYDPEDRIPFSILSQHPFIKKLMETPTHYQLVNIHKVLLASQDEGEA